jgi:small conductance mechanosensitive channel
MQEILNNLTALIIAYGLNLIWALLIFLIGRGVAGMASRLTKTVMTKANLDVTLVNFTGSLVYVGIVIFAGMAALSRLGVETTSVVAVLGAATLAVGLALQGALANFAAGFLILVFRPFKVGDFIEAGGAAGFVQEIQIFNTLIFTTDHKVIIIPNSHVTSGNITNHSTRGAVRLELVFGISPQSDLLTAKHTLEEIARSDDRVLADPPPTASVLSLADGAVQLALRPYVKVEDSAGVHATLTERVKLRFDDEAGISAPVPQRNIHIYQHASGEA